MRVGWNSWAAVISTLLSGTPGQRPSDAARKSMATWSALAPSRSSTLLIVSIELFLFKKEYTVYFRTINVKGGMLNKLCVS